jgi:hypothetical protein
MEHHKSSGFKAVIVHSLIYVATFTMVFLGMSYVLHDINYIVFNDEFIKRLLVYCIVINGFSHFIIDLITTRFTNKLLAARRISDFVLTLCIDQAIHIGILIWGLLYLVHGLN